MHKSCVTIQKNWRSQHIRAAYNFVIKKITAVQSVHRARSCRSKYKNSINCIISVQSKVRRYIVINRLSKAVSSNFKLRSFFRRYLLWRCKQAGFQEERDASRIQVGRQQLSVILTLLPRNSYACQISSFFTPYWKQET